MRPYWALIYKQIVEARFMLLLSAAALFGLAWLFVYVTSLNEAEIVRMLQSDEGGTRMQFLRSMGIADEPSSISLVMASWSHPFILLLVSMWSISRGSAAVAAEVERGTMDLILSRPVSRWAYLLSQVLVSLFGMAVLGGALFVGTAIAIRYNVLQEPPSRWTPVRPAVNYAVLGLPIYGYTLLASSLDHVRWRPTSVGSVLTLRGFIAYFVSLIPVLERMGWKKWLERITIFKAYNPVELVTTGESFGFNIEILTAIGAVAITLAFVVFAVRDLPTNG